MAFEELDDLLNTFAENDRATMRDILTRNNDGAAELARRNTVFNAFINGDTDAITQVADGKAGKKPAAATTPTTPTTPSTPSTSPSLDLDALNARLNSFRGELFSSPEVLAEIDKRADARAAAKFQEAQTQLIGRGAEIADELYTIRSTHSREFGEELDSAAFKKFFMDNAASYGGNLTNAYNAFVGEKRIEKRIEDARKEERSRQQTTQVPGTSLPTSNSPLGQMIRANAKATSQVEQGRGGALDAAAKAFRELQGGRTQ